MISKIILVAKREYKTRVFTLRFFVISLLIPLFLVLLTVVPYWLSTQFNEKINVEIVDTLDFFLLKPQNTTDFIFTKSTISFEEAKKKLKQTPKENYILVAITKKGECQFLSPTPLSIEKEMSLKQYLFNHLQKVELQKNNINLSQFSPHLDFKVEVLSGGSADSNKMASIIGGILSFLMYFAIFFYSSQVMHSVIEEKSNRIVEVVISSIEAFELLMGKILGVAAVGLTQFLLWGVTLALFILIATFYFTEHESISPVFSFLRAANEMNWWSIGGYFLFYFLGAYLLYSAIFASLGALVNSTQEAQQLTFPVSLPIIGAFMIAQYIFQNPHSDLAVWSSIIPFTSPIDMMVRLPYKPPFWQISVSMICLVLSFLGISYLAAKIYEIGILSYGKRLNFSEILKILRK